MRLFGAVRTGMHSLRGLSHLAHLFKHWLGQVTWNAILSLSDMGTPSAYIHLPLPMPLFAQFLFFLMVKGENKGASAESLGWYKYS